MASSAPPPPAKAGARPGALSPVVSRSSHKKRSLAVVAPSELGVRAPIPSGDNMVRGIRDQGQQHSGPGRSAGDFVHSSSGQRHHDVDSSEFFKRSGLSERLMSPTNATIATDRPPQLLTSAATSAKTAQVSKQHSSLRVSVNSSSRRFRSRGLGTPQHPTRSGPIPDVPRPQLVVSPTTPGENNVNVRYEGDHDEKDDTDERIQQKHVDGGSTLHADEEVAVVVDEEWTALAGRVSKLAVRQQRSRQEVEEEKRNLPADVVKLFSTATNALRSFDDNVLAITIHRTDELPLSQAHVTHPLVRVHVIDAATNSYVLKRDQTRPATTNLEPTSVAHIMPVLTQPYVLRGRGDTVARWNETIVIDDDYLSLLLAEPTNYNETSATPTRTPRRTMLLFELVDFNASPDRPGWTPIAWAFLLLVGAHGHANTERRARLQLYEYPMEDPGLVLGCLPRVRFRQATTRTRMQRRQRVQQTARPGEPALPLVSHDTLPNVPGVYAHWADVRRARRAYPSSLHVTVRGIPRPTPQAVTSRPMLATQYEIGHRGAECHSASVRFHNETNVLHDEQEAEAERPRRQHQLERERRVRVAGAPCAVPDAPLYSLATRARGCLRVLFSGDGALLACACVDECERHPVLLYACDSGALLHTLEAHCDLVYDLSFSRDSSELVTASSDGTARVWSCVTGQCVATLAHPCFVYAAQWSPRHRPSRIIVTAAFDALLRVWARKTTNEGDSSTGHGNEGVRLLAEIDGHTSRINTLCFDRDGIKLFTGDESGCLKVWVIDEGTDCSCVRTLEGRETQREEIVRLQVHPDGRKVVVQSKDGTVALLNLRTYSMSAPMGRIAPVNASTVASPCGHRLFVGEADGAVAVVDLDTSSVVARFSEPLLAGMALSDVAVHPREDVVAMCAFAPGAPVCVRYRKSHASERAPAGVFPRRTATHKDGQLAPSEQAEKASVAIERRAMEILERGKL